MKKTIILTETDLHRIIKETVVSILNENEGEKTLWAVWVSDAFGSLEFDAPRILLLIRANTKEEAERTAENRFITSNWMTDPVAQAHPATPEEIDRIKRRKFVDYGKR